jgi:Pre-mRNA splicing factor/N-terminal domain of CBF1 interacting co-repressor CIR
MGLAFLNKKSWHTGSFQNIEKVWIAEMKNEEEKRLTREAQRRLKEEQHYEELKRLQVEAGLIPKSHLQRLDWMYEGGAIKNTSSEEYLLGRPVTEPESIKGEWRPTLCKESTANLSNEIFTKVHEDPLFVILKEEQRRRKDILSNPQRMAELKKEIETMKKGKHQKHKKHTTDKYKSDDSTKESKKKSKKNKIKEVNVDSKYAPNWVMKNS